MFDRYITTGLSKSGTGETQGLEVGAEGVSVRVDGQITDKDADDLARALRYVLAGRLVPAEGGRL
ncbi:MAG: hypothetical protein ACRDP1_10405 [Nocardioidaceae bacterium]